MMYKMTIKYLDLVIDVKPLNIDLPLDQVKENLKFEVELYTK